MTVYQDRRSRQEHKPDQFHRDDGTCLMIGPFIALTDACGIFRSCRKPEAVIKSAGISKEDWTGKY